MPDGTGIKKALDEFPDRTWDTGICESHAMDMMAGLAKTGMKPFFAVYSTFLQRAFDQVFQEVALQGLPVRLRRGAGLRPPGGGRVRRRVRLQAVRGGQ